jgi:hypothetical protein
MSRNHPFYNVQAPLLIVFTCFLLSLAVSTMKEHRVRSASIVTLDPVVVSAKRERLPTVVIHGRRQSQADDRTVAAL